MQADELAVDGDHSPTFAKFDAHFQGNIQWVNCKAVLYQVTKSVDLDTICAVTSMLRKGWQQQFAFPSVNGDTLSLYDHIYSVCDHFSSASASIFKKTSTFRMKPVMLLKNVIFGSQK